MNSKNITYKTLFWLMGFLVLPIIFSMTIIYLSPYNQYSNPIGHNFLFGPAFASLVFIFFDKKFRMLELGFTSFRVGTLLTLILLLFFIYLAEKNIQLFLGLVEFNPSFNEQSFFGIALNPILSKLVYFFLLAIYTGFGEELAWRGYLFSKLKHLSWFQLVLVINIVWALWHLPLFFENGPYQGNAIFKFILFVICCIEFGILLLYLRVKSQSLIPCMVLHCFGSFIPYLLLHVYNINDVNWAGFPNLILVLIFIPFAALFYIRGRDLHNKNLTLKYVTP